MTIRLLRPSYAKASEDRSICVEALGDEEDKDAIEPTPSYAKATEDVDVPPVLPGNETLDGLARMAGVEALAREAGESVQPRDTLEELLTHELVAGHAFAMNVLCQANNQFLSVDAQAEDFEHLTRLNQATAKTGMVGVHMMTAVQRGVLLLDRLRHGIRYHHTVERVVAGTPAGGDSTSEPASCRS